MQFTKEEAIEKLNQELTNGGKKPLRMSAKTLESQVETLMAFVNDDEMSIDDFIGKVKGGIASINSNIEHDNSDFIKKYKEEHPIPAQTNKPEPNPSDPNAELLKRLEMLETRENERNERAAVESKRSEIRKYLSDNNVKDSKWIDSILGIATIGKDDNVEEKGKTYLDLYNQSLSGGSPIPPGKPAPSEGSEGDAFAEVRAMRKRRAEVQ